MHVLVLRAVRLEEVEDFAPRLAVVQRHPHARSATLDARGAQRRLPAVFGDDDKPFTHVSLGRDGP